jgi:AsmA protein
MNKKLRNIVIAVAVIIVILLVLPYFVNVESFRPKIESELSSALGRKAEIGDLSLSILRVSVSAANISIADDPAFSQAPFLTAKGLKIGVQLMPLIFSKKLNITGITLDEPSIALISNPGGKWNFSSLGGTQAKSETKSEPKSEGALPDNFSVAELQVSGGRLQVSEANSKAKPLIIDNVSIEVKDFSSTTQFPFTLTADLPGKGDMKLEGKAGPLAPIGTPIQANLEISNLDLAALGANPSIGLGGIGNLDGTLESDGKTAKVRGALSLDRLKLSPKGAPAGREIQVKIATDYDFDKQTGTFSQGEISVGKALAQLTGSFQTANEATHVNMILNAPGLPVEEVSALLPAFGVTLPAGSTLKGGTLSIRLDIKGPTDKLVITGPVKLENTSLAGFDLGSQLSALSAFAGKASPSRDTSIQNASMNTRMAPEGTRLDSINVAVPALGTLTGAGTVSPEGALDFRLLANLSGGAAGGVAQVAGLGRGKSGGGIPFAIEGTTANPKFRPDVKGMAGSAAQDAIGGALGTKSESTKKGLGGLLRK